MAKGWESKNVEEQQAENGVPASVKALAADKVRAAAVQVRSRQDLELQREQILNARTSNPHRRAALASALADVEARLATMA